MEPPSQENEPLLDRKEKILRMGDMEMAVNWKE